MITDLIFGLLTGTVFGYLVVPIVVISGRVSILIWAPIENKLKHQLPLSKSLTASVSEDEISLTLRLR